MLTMGKLLAECGMAEGWQVTYFPSYGAEVRGGTAHCQVVLSDQEIYSPLVEDATALLVMNQPSLERFGSQLVRGGLLVLNSSMAGITDGLPGRKVLEVPASDIARKMGSVRVANMVMLGALNGTLGLVKSERILTALAQRLTGKAEALMPLNEKALATGQELAARFSAAG